MEMEMETEMEQLLFPLRARRITWTHASECLAPAQYYVPHHVVCRKLIPKSRESL